MPGEMIRMKQAYTPKYDIRNFQQPEDAALNKFNELYMGIASLLGTADEDDKTEEKKSDDKTVEGDKKETTADKRELSWDNASADETPKIDEPSKSEPVVEASELSWAPDAGLSPNQTLGGEGGFNRSYVPTQDAARGLMDLRDSGKLDTDGLDWEDALNMFD